MGIKRDGGGTSVRDVNAKIGALLAHCLCTSRGTDCVLQWLHSKLRARCRLDGWRVQGEGDVAAASKLWCNYITCVIEGHLENPVVGRKIWGREEEQNGNMDNGNVSRISTRHEDHDNVDYSISQLRKSQFSVILRF